MEEQQLPLLNLAKLALELFKSEADAANETGMPMNRPGIASSMLYQPLKVANSLCTTRSLQR
jgi:hypothetical protein